MQVYLPSRKAELPCAQSYASLGVVRVAGSACAFPQTNTHSWKHLSTTNGCLHSLGKHESEPCKHEVMELFDCWHFNSLPANDRHPCMYQPCYAWMSTKHVDKHVRRLHFSTFANAFPDSKSLARPSLLSIWMNGKSAALHDQRVNVFSSVECCEQ